MSWSDLQNLKKIIIIELQTIFNYFWQILKIKIELVTKVHGQKTRQALKQKPKFSYVPLQFENQQAHFGLVLAGRLIPIFLF